MLCRLDWVIPFLQVPESRMALHPQSVACNLKQVGFSLVYSGDTVELLMAEIQQLYRVF